MPRRSGVAPLRRYKGFALTRALELPENIVYRPVDGRHLFIAPEGPSWIVADDVGALVLMPLHQGRTLLEAMDFAVAHMGVKPKEARAGMRALLAEIQAKHFFRGLPPIEPSPSKAKAVLHLFLTRRCNLRCIHCYVSGGEPLANELTTAEWKGVIDQFTDSYGHGIVTFSGGEPLCCQDFSEIAEYAKGKGHELCLFTNGTLIEDMETAQHLASLVDNIQLSLDAASPEVCAKVRGYGVFERVMAAIDLFKTLGKKLDLAFVVLPDNLEDLRANLVPLVRSVDYHGISINLDDQVTPTGRAAAFPAEYFQMETEARFAVNQLFQELREAGWTQPAPQSINRGLHHCGIGIGFTVDANGDIYPCPIPVCKYGNTRQDDVPSLIARMARLQGETLVTKMPTCAACEVRYVCNGMCRIMNYKDTGDFLTPLCDDGHKMRTYRRMIDMVRV